MADEWFVETYNFPSPILGTDPPVDTFRPINLDFTLRHKDAGDLSFDVSLAYPRMRWSIIGPKRMSFLLKNTDYEDPIMGGLISRINTKRGEEALHVFGKTWLWYLQNRHYPFNPQNPNAFLGGTAANDQGIAYQKYGDPADILTDILNITLGRPNSWPLQYLIPPFGVTHGFRVELGDTRTLFDMLTELSEADPGGFDFFDSPNGWITFWDGQAFPNEARTDPESCAHIFDRFTPPTDLVEAEFENNGPEGTHILALGAGTAHRIGRAYGYERSQEIYGRWDMTEDFGSVTSTTQLVNLAQAAFSKGLYPQHNIPLQVKPDEIPRFWELFLPGNAIWLRENWESNHTNGAHVLLEVRGHPDSAGNMVVDLTTEEINPTGRPGSVQG